MSAKSKIFVTLSQSAEYDSAAVEAALIREFPGYDVSVSVGACPAAFNLPNPKW